MVLSNLARLFYDEEFSGEVLEEPSNSRIEEHGYSSCRRSVTLGGKSLGTDKGRAKEKENTSDVESTLLE